MTEPIATIKEYMAVTDMALHRAMERLREGNTEVFYAEVDLMIDALTAIQKLEERPECDSKLDSTSK